MHLSVPVAVARSEAREPFRFLVKVGYAVKGCVYAILGVLAFRVGTGEGGRVAGEHDAMRQVARHSFGDAALAVIGAGLAFYALWRFLEATFDPYRVGLSLRGLAQRTGALVSAIGNGVAALTALQLALGERAAGKSPKIWAALVLREEWGPTLLMVVGACIAGVGVFHLYEALTDRFCDHIDLAGRSRGWKRYVTWSGRIGFIARGSLFAVIGVATVHAGATIDPRKIKGLREALLTFARQPYGHALLILAAVGLLAYALHLISTAPARKLGV
jgi:hypothetical protein